MSIASRTTSIIGHIEDDYNALTRLGADLTGVDKNIENIASVVNDIYDKLPKVTGTGSDVNLTPTLKGGLNIVPIGNCEQNGTPTPDNPIDIKVVTGDNSVVVQNRNVWDEQWELGAINSYGVIIGSNNQIMSKNKIYVKPNTTYYAYNGDNTYSLYIFEYDKNNTLITSYGKLNTTFTINANTSYIRFYVNAHTSYSDNICINVSDSNNGTYTVHQEQTATLNLGSTYLAGIGDYKDKIVGKTDDWKIVRKVGRKYTFASGAVDGNVYYWSETNRVTTESTSQVVFANKLFFNGNYINLTNAKTNMQKYQIAVNNNGSSKNVFISNSDYSTKEQYESWFTSIGLVIYYQLATPTEETITDTTLINDLNNLADALSYDGVTNISITSDSNNAQMLVQVSALKGE